MDCGCSDPNGAEHVVLISLCQGWMVGDQNRRVSLDGGGQLDGGAVVELGLLAAQASGCSGDGGVDGLAVCGCLSRLVIQASSSQGGSVQPGTFGVPGAACGRVGGRQKMFHAGCRR